MKKISALLIAMLVILVGCSKPKESEKIEIAASFYPLAYFTQRIGGDKVSVVNIMDEGSDAHTFEPSVAQRLVVEEADLFVYNGLELESWAEKMIESIKSDVIVVNTSTGVNAITNEEAHDHENEHEEDEDHEHEEGEEHDHDHDHNHLVDPHIWLNPKTAQIQAENIYNALVSLDSENKAYYEANMKTLIGDFDELDALITTTVNTAANKRVVVDHKILSYMARDYHFEQVSINGLIPDDEPTIEQITSILSFIETQKVKTALFSVLSADKLATLIGKEVSINVMKINPMETVSGSIDYFDVMKENISAISEAMK